MPVSSNLTILENYDGAPTVIANNGRYGGGAGASVNTDIFIQGTQSLGRRVDNSVGGHGTGIASVNLSGAGTHVKYWVFITQWAQVNSLNMVLASGSTAATADFHTVPTTQFPPLGGFIPVWIDVNRTPETEGASTALTAINEVGLVVDIGDVGGNASNIIMDEVGYTTTALGGYTWTGTVTTGAFNDFSTFEASNNQGVFLTIAGIDFCYSRLGLSDSAASRFSDSGFTVVFPDQTLVASDFMGIDVDLTSATTQVTLSDGTIQSSNPAGATRKPDFLVTGSSGSCTLTNTNLQGMRLVQVNRACTVSGGTIQTQSLTASGGGSVSGVNIVTSTAANTACCTNIAFGPSDFRNLTFTQGSLGHAVEFTTTATRTFTNVNFSGYGGTPGSNGTANSGSSAAAIYNNSGGALTINISGGDIPSVRNGAGATTTIVASANVTLTGLQALSEVRAYVGTNPSTAVEIDGVENSGTSFTFSQGEAGNDGYIVIAKDDYENILLPITYSSSNQSIPIQQRFDRNYSNP